MSENEVWYHEGLRFKCTGCGKCCRGSPGVVWVSEEECRAIATQLGMRVDEFKHSYTRLIQEKRALLEKGSRWDCVLLQMKKHCMAYTVRPHQCRTFPWWKGMLSSKTEWESAKSYCEGLDHPEGKLFSKEEIDRLQSE